MPKLIRYPKGQAVSVLDDEWQVLAIDATEPGLEGKILIPFRLWLSHASDLAYQEKALAGHLGVWFESDADVLAHREIILAGLKLWPLVAIDFPIFRDGRGFSTAALLRERFGWKGELRAIGDVLIDQLLQLAKVGFDGFVLRADQQLETALRQFDLFEHRLQNDWRAQRSQLTNLGTSV